jgi:pimeloyl-ACP methyl ester carboxylesterase
VTDVVADVRGRGSPVVLLHGQPGGATDWEPVARLLESDFQVIVPDRPGYGRTGGRAVGFRDNAAAVGDLLRRLDVRPAVVVGHSWSGGVGIAMAEESPERVSGLVLVASVGPTEPPSGLDRALAMPFVGATVAAVTLNLAGRALSLPLVRQYLDRHLRGTSDESLVAVANAWRAGNVWRSYIIEQRALVEELPALAAGLATIAVPTTVVVGEADRIVPPATGERLAAGIPGAGLVRVPGVGHLLPQERPDTVAAAVAALRGTEG